MKRYGRYQILTLILSFVVITETILLIHLWIIRPKKIIKKPEIPKGKIAIVIDDWGYNLDNLYLVDQIKYPFTASVLPRLGHSRAVAEELHKRGFEVILHLPMEPHEKFRLEKNTILASMEEREIINIAGGDLTDIHYAIGVSNHMGSKATEDSRTMSIVLNELKKRGLFFLDSFVSPKSVCSNLAAKLHVGFAKRDVFLDNIEEPGYIKGQIYKLKRKAKMSGQAIGIGHDRRTTLEVLKEVMPELDREGYKFVFVSELIK